MEMPQIRVRVNLASTLKEGHRVAETTAEWVGSGPVDEDALRKALQTAYRVGLEQATAQNIAEGRIGS